VANSMETNEPHTVIGAAQMKLTDLHELIHAGVTAKQSDKPYDIIQGFSQGLVISKGAVAGATLVSMELRQLAVLQDIVAARPIKESLLTSASSIASTTIGRRRSMLGDDTAVLEAEEKKKKGRRMLTSPLPPSVCDAQRCSAAPVCMASHRDRYRW
jgi:hypothetical protein